MSIQPAGLTIQCGAHDRAELNGTSLHYVTAGDSGTPVLLIHGFPESWWAFRGLVPLLSRTHRVTAVDLRGFGDSSLAETGDNSETLARDVHALIAHLDFGPVHLLVQDISGAVGLRLALGHPDDLLSLTGVETGFAGFGLETFADVSQGGAWYIGPLATPQVAETFFAGRETELIGEFIMPFAVADRQSVSADDVSEFARGYARPGGWSGARTLYGSMVKEGEELQALTAPRQLALPTLAVDSAGSTFTFDALTAVHANMVQHVEIEDVGHYIAQEAPNKLADALLPFFANVDREFALRNERS